MKKILTLILLVYSANIFAVWSNVVKLLDGDMATYADYADLQNIKQNEKIIRMWSLFDYRTVQQVKPYKYLSEVTYDEYNCEEKTYKTLDLYWFSKHMGQGKVVYSRDGLENKPHRIMPSTMYQALLYRVCEKYEFHEWLVRKKGLADANDR